MRAQKTETTNRLKTEVQMKKMRPTQMFCAGVATLSSRKNSRRFAMKKRYATEMKRTRGSLATSAANGGFTSIMPRSVPVKSHGKVSTPLATPISSRIGRMM